MDETKDFDLNDLKDVRDDQERLHFLTYMYSIGHSKEAVSQIWKAMCELDPTTGVTREMSLENFLKNNTYGRNIEDKWRTFNRREKRAYSCHMVKDNGLCPLVGDLKNVKEIFKKYKMVGDIEDIGRNVELTRKTDGDFSAATCACSELKKNICNENKTKICIVKSPSDWINK